MRQRKSPKKRAGATTVEMAAVCSVFLLFLFGVMEYCRFVYVRNMVVNSARDGARFAVVHTQDTTNLASETQARVKTLLNGLDTTMANYSCQVYKADSTGNNVGQPYDAQFGEYIAVEVSLDYVPVLPAFLFMNKSYKVSSKSMMSSEAN